MTDREKAIVMAYTGFSMLAGDKIGEFYKYLSELYGRPVYTHEIIALDIEHKSKPDFLRLCEEEQPERKKGEWLMDGEKCGELMWRCSECGVSEAVPTATSFISGIAYPQWKFCPNCGADMREEGDHE